MGRRWRNLLTVPLTTHLPLLLGGLIIQNTALFGGSPFHLYSFKKIPSLFKRFLNQVCPYGLFQRIKVLLSFSFWLGFRSFDINENKIWCIFGPQSSVKGSMGKVFKVGLTKSHFRPCGTWFWCGMTGDACEFVRNALGKLFEDVWFKHFPCLTVCKYLRVGLMKNPMRQHVRKHFGKHTGSGILR